tara:strand:- start:18200 stop:18697 length:498 start_codon:yes stop_codon:yes gene_type:complete
MAEAEFENEFSEEPESSFEIQPSSLDQATHAEVMALYSDAQDNIRFSKNLQWRTMGGAIILFVILVLACQFTENETFFVNAVICGSFLVSAGAIYSLAILQSWQGTEREKIRELMGKLSNLSTLIHDFKSRMEANIHRYILLAFMIAGVLGANYLSIMMLMPLTE